MKDDNVWDIAYWNPTDEVTDEELQRFLDSGVGTASSNPDVLVFDNSSKHLTSKR